MGPGARAVRAEPIQKPQGICLHFCKSLWLSGRRGSHLPPGPPGVTCHPVGTPEGVLASPGVSLEEGGSCGCPEGVLRSPQRGGRFSASSTWKNILPFQVLACSSG